MFSFCTYRVPLSPPDLPPHPPSRLPLRAQTFSVETSSRSQSHLAELASYGFVTHLPVRCSRAQQAPTPALVTPSPTAVTPSPSPPARSRVPTRSQTLSAAPTPSRSQSHLTELASQGLVSRLPVRRSRPQQVSPQASVTRLLSVAPRPPLEARRAARANRRRPWVPTGQSATTSTTAQPAPASQQPPVAPTPADAVPDRAPLRSILSTGRTDSTGERRPRRVAFEEWVDVLTVDRWIITSRHVFG
jgi:hypothetical protein